MTADTANHNDPIECHRKLDARARKVAKERMAEQFGSLLDERGVLVVDCGELGFALVTKVEKYGYFNVQWLEPEQMVTLAGRFS